MIILAFRIVMFIFFLWLFAITAIFGVSMFLVGLGWLFGNLQPGLQTGSLTAAYDMAKVYLAVPDLIAVSICTWTQFAQKEVCEP